MPPITVKKKKLTVKTVRAKQDDAAAAESTANADLPPGAEPVSKDKVASPAVAETPEAKSPEAAAPAAVPVAAAPATAKPASYVLAGTLAIIGVIMFISLIVIQFMEWDFFKDAFPRPQAPMTAPSGITAPASPAMPLDPEPLDTFDD